MSGKGRRPRVAVCIGHFEYGGQGTVVEQELIHLQSAFDLTLIAGAITRSLPGGVDAWELGASSRSPLRYRALAESLHDFDLIHCHDSLAFMLGSRQAKRPFVVTSHGIAPVRLRSTLRSKLEGLSTLLAYPPLYRSATLVIAISDYIAHWLRGFAKADAKVIRNGTGPVVDAARPAPASPYLLYVGELTARKGVHELIDGFAACPPPLALHLVGRGDDYILRQQVGRAGLSDRVTFHGVVDEVHLATLYRQAFAVVSASYWEGFGLPILEGFRFGSPAIVRRQGGMEELLRLSRGGLTFDHPADLNKAVKAVEKEWSTCSTNALAFAHSCQWHHTFTAYEKTFWEILGDG